MRLTTVWLGAICMLALNSAPVSARVQVLSSVKPVQLLVDAVAPARINSELLLPAQMSPHDFALRFSDLRRLQRADVIVWLGPRFEHYMIKPLQQRDRGQTVSLLAVHDDGDGRKHDPHIWLDPLAVSAAAERIAAALTRADPGNADSYHSALQSLQEQLNSLHQRNSLRFKPLAGKGVITTHAGLQHFLHRYQLQQFGSVYAGPHDLISLKHIDGLRARIARGETRCVMLEPQYQRARIAALFKNLDVNLVELDVLGTGASSFVELLEGVSDAVYRCLTSQSAEAAAGFGNLTTSVK